MMLSVRYIPIGRENDNKSVIARKTKEKGRLLYSLHPFVAYKAVTTRSINGCSHRGRTHLSCVQQ